MTELPEPLTPPGCDLRTYEWMPLDVNRLLTSETWILGTADECKTALTLWCESWRQVPAASLPDDDRMLAHLSRAGASWKKVREAVLRSWVKCSDGRLYHPVVAEKAKEAMALKAAQANRTEAARKAKEVVRVAKLNGSGQIPPTEDVTDTVTKPVTISVTDAVTEAVTASNRTEQNRTDKEERAYPADTAPAVAAPPEPSDLKTQVWRDGKRIVASLTGQPEREAGAFVGRIAGVLKQDFAGMLAIFREAERLRPLDPSAWIMAAAQSRTKQAASGISPRREKILRAAGLWGDGPLIEAETIYETPRGLLQ